MRRITKDIQITIDGSPVGFRLSKLDAFSGVMLLRLGYKMIKSVCSSQQKLDTPTRIFRQPALRNYPCIVSASDIQENRRAAVR